MDFTATPLNGAIDPVEALDLLGYDAPNLPLNYCVLIPAEQCTEGNVQYRTIPGARFLSPCTLLSKIECALRTMYRGDPQ